LDGDSDLDARITADDYNRLDRGYLSHGDTYREGDFNYDGAVNIDDYALIDGAWVVQQQPDAVPVPEPEAFAFLAAAVLFARRCQSRIMATATFPPRETVSR
jgi:hypothetical protein